ncbi:MAG: methionine adenosyltransferase [Lentisphaeria bacterium]|nr:methionine adenosyltransferase [Lentisphaeria bacterium]
MSKINTPHIYTSESVSEGHPDKVCDQISDAILDACLTQDPNSRVACETLTTTNLVVVAGEITTSANVDYEKIAREKIREIGYNDPALLFDADSCEVQVRVHTQSADISQGVTEGEGLYKEQGAGDQGMMFGYASNETEELMPAPVYYSHRLLESLAEIRKAGTHPIAGLLRPDSKSQISIRYVNGKPQQVEAVVISHQHAEELVVEDLTTLVKELVKKVIPASLLNGEEVYYINPTGRFVIGGPHGDCGLTGRKIIVDTYGGVGSHGGGAFSGKDPSKVDRSAAYMSRYVAKNIVAAGLAEKCEVQVAYAIGVPYPVSINVDTYGTGKVEDAELQTVLESNEIFDLRPAYLVAALGLKNPTDWKYADSARYGHFGRSQFPWEKTDKVEALRAKFA